jgi:hypothetical protein
MGKKHRKGQIRICPRTGKRMYRESAAKATIKVNTAGIRAYYLCTACGSYHLTSNGKGYKGEIAPS